MTVLAYIIYALVLLILLPYAIIALAGIGAGTFTLLKGGGRSSTRPTQPAEPPASP